jgi:hypothetical protein
MSLEDAGARGLLAHQLRASIDDSLREFVIPADVGQDRFHDGAFGLGSNRVRSARRPADSVLGLRDLGVEGLNQSSA